MLDVVNWPRAMTGYVVSVRMSIIYMEWTIPCAHAHIPIMYIHIVYGESNTAIIYYICQNLTAHACWGITIKLANHQAFSNCAAWRVSYRSLTSLKVTVGISLAKPDRSVYNRHAEAYSYREECAGRAEQATCTLCMYYLFWPWWCSFLWLHVWKMSLSHTWPTACSEQNKKVWTNSRHIREWAIGH